ncbi:MULTISPECIES: YfjI family protein [unclassified Pseudomonas]|uniref:YfjI family protein n=1 Tax=unclassified Pseudomonas TaxID=196821 RepID=UPI0015A39B96|nr:MULTISPECIES: YfjI family protein [unclassified Pseudomonas]NWC91058.1 DUF3987 domain-containing protein [Pseudomonas sp. IPO3779]NWD16537.1 DUF3987 domain-containing protein [Pseudomonas sp. IPO3778]
MYRNYLNFSAIDSGEFPSLIGLSLISAAVHEVSANVKAPLPLIFSSALTAMSVGLQGLYDVKKPNGGTVPCSLMILTIANSGERKSTVENIFLAGLRRIQDQMADRYAGELSVWKTKLKIWELKDKTIQRNIVNRVNKGADTTEDERRLFEHAAMNPKKPRKFKMLYEDSTSQALFRGLHQDFPSAGLISGEGAGVLNGPALNDLTKQNSIWSGDSVVVDRVTTESYQLDDARLTVSLMVQESAFTGYMQVRGETSRGSGLWARFLVCQPASTQGSRRIDGVAINKEHSELFSERLCHYVERNIELLGKNKQRREVISFSLEAAQRWVQLGNEIETQIGQIGRFKSASDHASKLADNIARLAALFHCFEKFEGDISVSTLNIAISIGKWYSNEFLKLFDVEGQKENDVNELVDWLVSKCGMHEPFIRKNIVRQYGPSRLREKKRLDDALALLQMRGVVQVGYGTGGLLINLCPSGGAGVWGYTKQGRGGERGF